MKRCRGCIRLLEDSAFPEPGSFEAQIELTGERCMACVRATVKEMGWGGFDPHGRAPGPIARDPRKIGKL